MSASDHDPFPELLLARQDDDALGQSMLIYPDRTPARNLFWLTLAVFVLLYALPWRETYFQACVLTFAIYTLPTVWSWGWQNYAHLDIQTIYLSADEVCPVTVLRLLQIMGQIICAFCRAIRKRDMCVPVWIRAYFQ